MHKNDTHAWALVCSLRRKWTRAPVATAWYLQLAVHPRSTTGCSKHRRCSLKGAHLRVRGRSVMPVAVVVPLGEAGSAAPLALPLSAGAARVVRAMMIYAAQCCRGVRVGWLLARGLCCRQHCQQQLQLLLSCLLAPAQHHQ